MGLSESKIQSEDEIIKEFFEKHPELINVGIDESLVMFSGTNSTAQLEGYSSNLQKQLIDRLPAYVEKVAGVLKGFTSVPNAVGLGAFVISMNLQMAFNSIKGSSSNNGPMNMLRRVFAEEKSSKVRDLMDEYLKRHTMYLDDNIKLLKETERLESKLSLQLTGLESSIRKEKQMSRCAIKHWVNGAAFHVQMLIHIARLKQGTVGFETARRAADRAADIYQRHVSEILKQYKEYTSLKFKVRPDIIPHIRDPHAITIGCFIIDVNGKQYSLDEKYNLPEEDYHKIIFSKLKEISDYFNNLHCNLNVLVKQTGNFYCEIPKN